MLATKTKEHIRRRAAILIPRWGTLLGALAALGICVAFTGTQLRVVEITDSHGARGVTITMAQEIDTLMAQTGISTPATDDELLITEEDGRARIHILRAYTVPVIADGAEQDVVVTGGTVADALQKCGITWEENDIVEPALDSETQPGTSITVHRVRYEEYTLEESIPVDVQRVETSLFYRCQNFEQVAQEGREGRSLVSYRETYVDGELTETIETGREILTEMVPRIVKCYGEGTPVSSFTGPEIVDGKPAEGIAAVYTAQRSTGYSASATARGASGRRLTYGTVAVNPSIIPYGSLMYITSADGQFVYGYAYAADTGTAMMTGHAFIDLYYETYAESVKSAVIPVNVYVLDAETAAQYKEANDAIFEADTIVGR